MFSPETIQQVKSLDFPSYLRHSGLNLLSTNGGTAYKALCPFHEDKNPSLSVTLKDKGWLWHCFGCNAGGDAIEFVKKREGLSFREAVIKLSPEALRLLSPLPAQRKEGALFLSERKRILSAVTEYYHQILLERVQDKNKDSHYVKSRYYLQKRGLLNENLIKTFKIGISDGSLNKALQNGEVPGLQYEERSILCSQLGIFKSNYVETFSSALIFPVIDVEGNTTEIYARRILHYLNRTNHCYTKGEHVGLWNFIGVKNSDTVILTEGIIDALSLYKAGFHNVTALYGANGYTPAHDALFKNKKCVIFALDNDDVGIQAVQRLKEILKHLNHQIIVFPQEHKDANGVLASEGVDALRNLVLEVIENGGREREEGNEKEERKREGENGEGGKEERENGETFVNKSFSKPLQKTLTGEKVLSGESVSVLTLPFGMTSSHSSPASDQKTLTGEKVLSGEMASDPARGEGVFASPLAGEVGHSPGEGITPVSSAEKSVSFSSSDLIYHGDKLRYELRNAFALKNLNYLKLVMKVSSLTKLSLTEGGTPSVTPFPTMPVTASDAPTASGLPLSSPSSLIHSPSHIIHYTDRVDFYAARSRKLFIAALCERFDLQGNAIENDLQKITEIIERHYKNKEAPKEKTFIPIMSQKEKEEAVAFLKSHGLLALIIRDLTLLGYIGDDTNKLLLYLAATSRKLPKPLSVLIRSQSSTGKSYLIDLICSVMPVEDVIKLTSMTPKALYYVEADALKHKFLAIDERAGMEEAEYSIRSLQSGGKLTMAAPNKNPLTGKIETTQIEREGPISYVDGSTDTRVNPENANRCFEIFLDESSKQTSRIQEEQRKAHSLEGLKNKALRDSIRRKHQNAQRLLKSVHVVIPYAHLIQFPADWIRTRRDHDRFLNLIVVIAFLHQYQRPLAVVGNVAGAKEGVPYIEATEEDYSSAYKLASDVLGNTFAELDKTTSDFYAQLESMVEIGAKASKVPVEEYTFTRRQARNFTKLAPHVVKNLMRTLTDLEYLDVKKAPSGSKYFYALAEQQKEKGEILGLTTPQELKDKLQDREAHHNPTASTVVAVMTKGSKK